MIDNETTWLSEYREFAKTQIYVPHELNKSVKDRIISLISPSWQLVMSKLLAVHAVVGFASLAICHQFGMNPFGTSYSIADWFAKLGGHEFCVFGCGIVFVSLSVLVASYVLTREEVKVLASHGFAQSFAISIGSLVIFALGAELTLFAAALWLLGAVAAGGVTTKSALRLRGV